MTAPAKTDRLEDLALRTLLERRQMLVQRRTEHAREAQRLYEEKEPDWEDRAADVTNADALEHLSDNERAQLARVDLALRRLADGTWGWCVVCGSPIPRERLRAIPEAVRCASCTNHH